MDKGSFKRLIRTLRNKKHEAIQIKRDDSSIVKGKEIEKSDLQPDEDSHNRDK